MPKSKEDRVREYLQAHPGFNPLWAVAKECNLFPIGVSKICRTTFEKEVRIKYKYQNPPKEVIALEWVGV